MATQQAAAQRTNTKKTVKFYDEQTVNGWALTYGYESENGAKPSEVKVNGTNASKAVSVVKNSFNTSVAFSGGGEMDADLLATISAEISAIEAGFAPAQQPPTEG